jgi:hypothetical protein
MPNETASEIAKPHGGCIIDDLRQGDEPLSFAAAARLSCVRRDGKSPDASAIYRWAGKGLYGCRLETARVGGRMVTTRSAVLRFIALLSGIPTSRAVDARQIHTQALRALDRAGI